MGYYIKVTKMGEIAKEKYGRKPDADEDGVVTNAFKCVTEKGIDTRFKIEDLPFTPDGIGVAPNRHNVFKTPREALLTFTRMLERHPDWDYVDIVMVEYKEYIGL